MDASGEAVSWIVRNQDMLPGYVVNLVAAVALFLSALIRHAIIAFTLIAALGRVGVQTASVIAVPGAAGLVVGLSLQGALSNLAAGILLVMFRPFRSGEYADLGGVAGTVQSVHIFSTTMRTLDGKIVVIPNGKVIAGEIA